MKKTKIKYFLIFTILLASVLCYNLWPAEKLPANVVVDKIVVLKSQRQLQVYEKGQLLKTYKVALGKNPVGAKQVEGDKKTPEGLYVINAKTEQSKFHKNLGISYPNRDDVNSAAKMGKPTGGDIKIHGLQNGIGFIGRLQTLSDWTAGCIALTNQEVDDLYEHTPIGTPVEIKP